MCVLSVARLRDVRSTRLLHIPTDYNNKVLSCALVSAFYISLSLSRSLFFSPAPFLRGISVLGGHTPSFLVSISLSLFDLKPRREQGFSMRGVSGAQRGAPQPKRRGPGPWCTPPQVEDWGRFTKPQAGQRQNPLSNLPPPSPPPPPPCRAAASSSGVCLNAQPSGCVSIRQRPK